MTSKIFSLMIAVGAFVSTGSAVSIAPKTHNQEVNSAVNHAKIGNQTSPTGVSQEVNIEKDRPKPERKKRSTAGKIFDVFMAALGVAVVVFLLAIGLSWPQH
jgi:hypothetical protein